MARENVVNGNDVRVTYWSLDEYADAAERRVNDGIDHVRTQSHMSRPWRGASWADALRMAREGWTEQLDAALEIAESAVDLVEKEHEVDTFAPAWDLSGQECDLGRYLAHEPECMIDYPPTKTSKVGRVITLCASVAYSGSIEPETMIRRGQVVTAFALALNRLGHSVEMWMDITTRGYTGNYSGTVRVLVKGANDVLDPARILYAYAHPSTLRRLWMGVTHGFPKKFHEPLSIGGLYGVPIKPPRDLPEGTLYLPELCSNHDVKDAHTELKNMLRQVGLLKED